jgi:hypothetical protein
MSNAAAWFTSGLLARWLFNIQIQILNPLPKHILYPFSVIFNSLALWLTRLEMDALHTTCSIGKL